MKNLKYLFLSLLSIFIISCEEEESSSDDDNNVPVEVNEISIIPSSTSGRPNNYLGCIEISSRITTIEVWDHGQIDGDIVSIIANGNVIIDQQVLDGPGNPIVTDYDFGYNGFNYVTLYAHNLGDIPPNTCTIAINGVEFILEANLDANGSVDVIVGGYGVDCSNAGGGGGGGGGGGETGDAIFWVGEDLGCGPISVELVGEGSSTISAFYNSTPECTDTGAGGNFNNLAPGTYNFNASCQGLDWSGAITIVADNCTTQQLLSSGGGGGGGGGNNTGDVIFWINQDYGCGPISVNVSSVGSSSITGFYGSAPNCSDTGAGGNFNSLAPGTYNYTASCQGIDWSGNFSVNANECLRFQLAN
jgi:hypothetical protein